MIDIQRLAPDTIRIERLLDAPVEKVWRYLVESELRATWFAGGELEQREGGTIQLIFDHDNLSSEDVPYPVEYAAHKGAGSINHVLAIEPNKLLSFSWSGGKEGTVRFELFPVGDRTRLVLTHSGITGPGPMALFGGGWASHLTVLETRLAGGTIANFWTLHAATAERVRAALAEAEQIAL